MRILNTYILRLHLVPFLLGFGVVTFILEMDVMFDYLDLVVNRGVAIGIVAQLFMLSLGYIVALSVPCAVLVAVLMTFGRLSQDNEITALRASGVNLARILLWPLGAAGVVAGGLVLFNNHVLPEANHLFANLLIDIGRMRPTVKLQEGVFITDFPGYNLLVQSVNGRTNEMRGVTIYQFNPGGPPTTILAKSGFLSYTPDGRTAIMQLRDGEIHDVPQDEPERVTPAGDAARVRERSDVSALHGAARKYRRLVFKQHTLYIANAGGILERSVRDSRSDREMSARSLMLERNRIRHDFEQSLALHRLRFRQLGLPMDKFEDVVRQAGLDAPGLEMWWQELTGAPDALTRLAQAEPVAGTDLELLRTERDDLRKRVAGLSVEIHK